jgi:hypothetical protein
MYWNYRCRQRSRRHDDRTRGSNDEAVASAAIGAATRPVARDMDATDRGSGSPVETGPRDLTGNDGAFGDHSADRSAHRIYAEVLWSTFDRLPLVAPEARASVETGLIALCRRLDVEPVAVRVSATRARLVLRFKPAHSIGAVVTALKLGSQDAAVVAGRPIRWAPGFACLTLSVTEVRRRALRLRARH